MKKFIVRLIFFCLLPLAPLLFVARITDKGLHKSRWLYYADWNDLYGGVINADMLVMGTSRAYLHVSPAILDSILGTSSYNLGMDGASITLQHDILKLYLQHNKKPRYIIQEVGYPTFVASDSIQYFQEFVSYIDDTAVWNILKRHYAPLSFADRHFPLYKYNGNTALIKEGLMSFIGKGATDVKYKGYEARDIAWDSSFHQFKKNHPHGMVVPVDSSEVLLFNRYLDECAAQGIRVILFHPPAYYQYIPYILNYNAIHNMMAGCAAAHGVPFLDYSTDTMCYNRSWFYNSQHLNKKGSEVFSVKLANDIKPIITKPAPSKPVP